MIFSAIAQRYLHASPDASGNPSGSPAVDAENHSHMPSKEQALRLRGPLDKFSMEYI